MTTPEKYVPRALREVWEWKDAIYQEVKHLPRGERLRAILDDAAHAARELGMTARQPLVIRETSPKYGSSKPAARKKSLTSLPPAFRLGP